MRMVVVILSHVPQVLTIGSRVVKTPTSRLKPPKFILTRPLLSYLTVNRLLVSAVTWYSCQS